MRGKSGRGSGKSGRGSGTKWKRRRKGPRDCREGGRIKGERRRGEGSLVINVDLSSRWTLTSSKLIPFSVLVSDLATISDSCSMCCVTMGT